MADRKQEILKRVLNCFIENGLNATSMRDAAKAVGIEAATLYYYFKNKEEMVTQCADLAIRELSEKMIARMIFHMFDFPHLAERLMVEARVHIPLMRFIVSVRVSPEYGDNITESIRAFSGRYESYVQRMAQKLDCDAERIRPVVYMMIVSVVNYMLFGEASLFMQQFVPIQKELSVIASGGKNENDEDE